MRKGMLFLATGLIFSGTAYSFNYDRAINLSEDLKYELTDLAQEARAEARAANRDRRKQKLLAVARQARELKQAINQELIPKLEREARQRRIKRVFDNQIKPEFQDIKFAIEDMRRVPYGITEEYDDVRAAFRKLNRLMNRSGDGGTGGGRFVGQCKVVLETLWGHDMSEFYGTASARSQEAAKQQAKADALSQCRDNGGDQGLLKCNVVGKECFATGR